MYGSCHHLVPYAEPATGDHCQTNPADRLLRLLGAVYLPIHDAMACGISLAAVAALPLVAFAQDTASRAARAVDLAGAHAIAVDSQSAVAARWHASLERNRDDRLAAFGLANLARLTYAAAADRELAQLATGSDAVARRAMLGRAQVVAATGQWAIADSLYAAAAARAAAAHDSILEADAAFGQYAMGLARFRLALAGAAAAHADSVRPPADVLLAAASVCARAALAPSAFGAARRYRTGRSGG